MQSAGPAASQAESSPVSWLGVMTGTSMDGIDVCLINCENDDPSRPRLLDFASTPMPPALVKRLQALQTMGSFGEGPGAGQAAHQDPLDAAAQAGLELAQAIGQAVVQMQARHPGQRIAAVGVHGQTVRHRPERGYSLQLLHAPTVAEQTGLPVVYDFRNRDIAAGGQGAPLVPAFHAALLSGKRPAALLNLGGLANLSLVNPDEVLGFDTGPGNTLLDAWAHEQTGQALDLDGRLAASGEVHPGLLKACLSDPYFAAPAPKSTGRDAFHLGWLAAKAQAAGLSLAALPPEDVQRTLVALTAQTIAQQCPPGFQRLYVCGGGVHNPVLMTALSEALPAVSIDKTEALGWPTQAIEAAAFAWLARACLRQEPGNRPSVTGARGPRILGSICPA